MRKILIVLLLLLCSGIALAKVMTSASITYERGQGPGSNKGLRLIRFVIGSDTEAGQRPASITTRPVYGQLLQLSVGSISGTGGAFGLQLQDENLIIVASETGITTADSPQRFALTASESTTQNWKPWSGGNLILTASGIHGLTRVEVDLYFIEYWE